MPSSAQTVRGTTPEKCAIMATSSSNKARRLSGEGFVTVSLRRSITESAEAFCWTVSYILCPQGRDVRKSLAARFTSITDRDRTAKGSASNRRGSLVAQKPRKHLIRQQAPARGQVHLVAIHLQQRRLHQEIEHGIELGHRLRSK